MRKIRKNEGITLIALVITIIVLLILAGISIATLTGENVVLTKATKAKNKTQREGAKEKVQVAVMGSYGTDSRINLEELNKNLKNVEGLTYEGNAISETNKIESLENDITVEVDGYDVIISGNGKVNIEEEEEKKKIP